MRVAIIGNFDGVHRGHQELIRRAAESAGESEPARVIAVTFDPHPTAVVRPDRTPAALTSLDRRRALLREAGADEVVVFEFTPEFAQASPEEFARRLADPTGIAADLVIVGANFRFGKDAAGDTQTLAHWGESLGFDVDVVPLVAAPGQSAVEGMAWSSTSVRQSIAAGDLAAATEVLGRPHRLEGPVVRGDQRGRLLGYPTANIEVPSGMAIPPDGVYAGWLIVGSQALPAAISIGTNPQFAGTEHRVEAYALDRDDLDLYGQWVGVDLVARLRGQEVFESVEGLQAQMAADVAAARECLSG